jgi:hypothetical protein
MTAAVLRETEPMRQSRRRVQGLLRGLSAHARAARVAETRRARTEAAATRLAEAHPELMAPDAGRDVTSLFFAVVVLGTYVLDVVLFGATAEYFAKENLGAAWVERARYAIPAVILLVEVVLSVQLHLAREEAAETRQYGALVVCGALAAIFTLVMPAAVVATQLASRPPELGESDALALDAQLFVLVVLAFTAHALVVFTGRPGHAAKVTLAFRARHGFGRARLWMHERAYDRAAARTHDTYVEYTSARELHNASYPQAPLAPGPFTAATREVLREIAGYEVIRLVDAPPEKASPPAASLEPKDDIDPNARPPRAHDLESEVTP